MFSQMSGSEYRARDLIEVGLESAKQGCEMVMPLGMVARCPDVQVST